MLSFRFLTIRSILLFVLVFSSFHIVIGQEVTTRAIGEEDSIRVYIQIKGQGTIYQSIISYDSIIKLKEYSKLNGSWILLNEKEEIIESGKFRKLKNQTFLNKPVFKKATYLLYDKKGIWKEYDPEINALREIEYN